MASDNEEDELAALRAAALASLKQKPKSEEKPAASENVSSSPSRVPQPLVPQLYFPPQQPLMPQQSFQAHVPFQQYTARPAFQTENQQPAFSQRGGSFPRVRSRGRGRGWGRGNFRQQGGLQPQHSQGISHFQHRGGFQNQQGRGRGYFQHQGGLNPQQTGGFPPQPSQGKGGNLIVIQTAPKERKGPEVIPAKQAPSADFKPIVLPQHKWAGICSDSDQGTPTKTKGTDKFSRFDDTDTDSDEDDFESEGENESGKSGSENSDDEKDVDETIDRGKVDISIHPPDDSLLDDFDRKESDDLETTDKEGSSSEEDIAEKMDSDVDETRSISKSLSKSRSASPVSATKSLMENVVSSTSDQRPSVRGSSVSPTNDNLSRTSSQDRLSRTSSQDRLSDMSNQSRDSSPVSDRSRSTSPVAKSISRSSSRGSRTSSKLADSDNDSDDSESAADDSDLENDSDASEDESMSDDGNRKPSFYESVQSKGDTRPDEKASPKGQSIEIISSGPSTVVKSVTDSKKLEKSNTTKNDSGTKDVGLDSWEKEVEKFLAATSKPRQQGKAQLSSRNTPSPDRKSPRRSPSPEKMSLEHSPSRHSSALSPYRHSPKLSPYRSSPRNSPNRHSPCRSDEDSPRRRKERHQERIRDRDRRPRSPDEKDNIQGYRRQLSDSDQRQMDLLHRLSRFLDDPRNRDLPPPSLPQMELLLMMQKLHNESAQGRTRDRSDLDMLHRLTDKYSVNQNLAYRRDRHSRRSRSPNRNVGIYGSERHLSDRRAPGSPSVRRESGRTRDHRGRRGGRDVNMQRRETGAEIRKDRSNGTRRREQELDGHRTEKNRERTGIHGRLGDPKRDELVQDKQGREDKDRRDRKETTMIRDAAKRLEGRKPETVSKIEGPRTDRKSVKGSSSSDIRAPPAATHRDTKHDISMRDASPVVSVQTKGDANFDRLEARRRKFQSDGIRTDRGKISLKSGQPRRRSKDCKEGKRRDDAIESSEMNKSSVALKRSSERSRSQTPLQDENPVDSDISSSESGEDNKGVLYDSDSESENEEAPWRFSHTGKSAEEKRGTVFERRQSDIATERRLRQAKEREMARKARDAARSTKESESEHRWKPLQTRERENRPANVGRRRTGFESESESESDQFKSKSSARSVVATKSKTNVTTDEPDHKQIPSLIPGTWNRKRPVVDILEKKAETESDTKKLSANDARNLISHLKRKKGDESSEFAVSPKKKRKKKRSEPSEPHVEEIPTVSTQDRSSRESPVINITFTGAEPAVSKSLGRMSVHQRLGLPISSKKAKVIAAEGGTSKGRRVRLDPSGGLTTKKS